MDDWKSIAKEFGIENEKFGDDHIDDLRGKEIQRMAEEIARLRELCDSATEGWRNSAEKRIAETDLLIAERAYSEKLREALELCDKYGTAFEAADAVCLALAMPRPGVGDDTLPPAA